jgi:hypothetical protein
MQNLIDARAPVPVFKIKGVDRYATKPSTQLSRPPTRSSAKATKPLGMEVADLLRNATGAVVHPGRRIERNLPANTERSGFEAWSAARR